MIGYNLVCETAIYFVYESGDGSHELYIKKETSFHVIAQH